MRFGCDRHLDQVAGQPKVTGLGQLPGAVCERLDRSGQSYHLGRQGRFGRRLQVGCVSIPPPAELPIDVSHHELRLVVLGGQPGPVLQVFGHGHLVDDRV